MEDLRPGTRLPGIITNVTAFGAFVDIGVHQDGLVHISELAEHFVKDPREVVKVRQRVEVKVLNVDLERGRISLSMKRSLVCSDRIQCFESGVLLKSSPCRLLLYDQFSLSSRPKRLPRSAVE